MLKKKTMKTIYLVRHGRASESVLGLSDKDRPLEPRGILETRELTKKLAYEGVKPTLIVSSTAVRAHQTALEMARVLGFPQEKIQLVNALYLAEEDTILDALTFLSDEVDSVILVAHNPGITDFAHIFLNQPLGSMATSTIVSLQFNLKHWLQLPISRPKTTRIYMPDNLSS